VKYLIIGLGNIGAEYEATRHNVGFMVLDQMAAKLGFTFENARLAYKAEGKYKGRPIHFIKPTTYMNLSGKSMAYWMQALKIPVENTLVITDDISIPLGKLRMKPKGSSGGHNGLKDIEKHLSGSIYPRLRFGIGDDFSKGNQVDYVLGTFDKKELEQLPELIDKSCEMILSFCTQGIDRTMNQFNN